MKELIEILIRMRSNQKEYYIMKTQANLKRAMASEMQADKAIKAYQEEQRLDELNKLSEEINGHPFKTLFDEFQ